jgi:hypothetical protein
MAQERSQAAKGGWLGEPAGLRRLRGKAAERLRVAALEPGQPAKTKPCVTGAAAGRVGLRSEASGQ